MLYSYGYPGNCIASWDMSQQAVMNYFAKFKLPVLFYDPWPSAFISLQNADLAWNLRQWHNLA